jgi:hypothetical protein
MELIKIIGWAVLGFVRIFGGLELVSRKLKDREKIVLRTDIREGEELVDV